MESSLTGLWSDDKRKAFHPQIIASRRVHRCRPFDSLSRPQSAVQR
jgi:hypothetical protein